MSELLTIPASSLSEVLAQLSPQGGESLPFAEQEALEPLAQELKQIALDFAQDKNSPEWVMNALRGKNYLDGIISELRHLAGGQEFILKELQKLKPDLCWYRGGTLTQWQDGLGKANRSFYTDQELETYVIDGGANGVLGRPRLAVAFLERAKRNHPVLYTLSLPQLILGIQQQAISLVSEHDYDLRVIPRKDNVKYLEFCRKNLKIQSVLN